MIRHLITAAMLIATPAAYATVPAPIAAAVADPSRPAEDTARDAERKPADMLAFAGAKPGMAVLDFMPGGGYFTRLFSDVVGPKGKVIAYIPDEFLAKSQRPLERATAAAQGHANVQVEHNPLMAPGPDNVLDVVWTSQNYHDLHNLPGIDVVAFDKLVLRSLKPGGIFIILDHAAPAGSGVSDTNDLHRIDPAAVRKEAEAAGFVFVGESKVLANPADPRTAKVFDPSVRGHTDQFIYKFRRPK